jgi:ABC-type Fe3+ transport system permease subunit
MLLGAEVFQNKFTISPSRFAIHQRRKPPLTKPLQNGATISGSILCVCACVCFVTCIAELMAHSRGQGCTKRGSDIKLRLRYNPFQNIKQSFIIRGLTLSLTVFLHVPRLVILSAGDGMTILESGLFPFFQKDFSNFTGIYIQGVHKVCFQFQKCIRKARLLSMGLC